MTRHTPARIVCAALSALAVATPAGATENGQLRALLGLPGQDMTLPALPGFYTQANFQYYAGAKIKDNDGNTPVRSTALPPLGTLSAEQDTEINAQVLALRASWVSEMQLWDGRVGVSATLPLVSTEADTTLNRLTPVPPQFAPAVDGALAQLAAAGSGSESGVGDMEIAPFVDWQTDQSRVIFAPAVVAPVGSYDKNKVVNPGAGNFWTFRPILTLAYVTESGLEFGARTSYSFNMKNDDTGYTSGQYLHSDGALMYQVRDNLRLGLAGYLVWQTTKDKSETAGLVPEHGNKARVFGLGPSIGWQTEDSRLGLEFKVLQEFAARNRPEGTLAWLRVIYRVN